YKPELSEGAAKSPIFQTSTFVFKNAVSGNAFFELSAGLREPGPNEEAGLIYTRMNNPDVEILEERLKLWDGAEAAAIFSSGMSAISTAILSLVRPGDLVLYGSPLYGGTDKLMTVTLPEFGIHTLAFRPWESMKEVEQRIKASPHADRLAMIYIESPANPTNALTDIAGCRALADKLARPDRPVRILVDNTFLGPLWQHPLAHGADLVLYSATKYIAGHSDLVAGAACGSKALIRKLKSMRSLLGTIASPWTCWLMLRSLETLKIRMEQQARTAARVAAYLNKHPKIAAVHYLGNLKRSDGAQYRIYRKQCLGPGAMISIEVKGGRAQAFTFLDSLKLIKQAVSLGSTESLICHPASTTHITVAPAEKKAVGLTDQLVRFSVGVEAAEDLIWDIGQALAKI
ncbi:MAG: cystathionine gamma-synthase family protein, partial [Thermoflexales bacterium]|nr:cystathionine gamma-synthase family protein [Thermoflexales bacterium]